MYIPIYIYASMYIYVYTDMLACTYIRISVYLHAHIQIYAHAYCEKIKNPPKSLCNNLLQTLVRLIGLGFFSICVCKYARMHAYAYIHILIYLHVHISIYTYACMQIYLHMSFENALKPYCNAVFSLL